MAYVTVEVDVDDVLDSVSDRDLLAEYRSRGLDGKNEPDAQAVVSRALSMIRTGRVADGVTMIEREFFPTWKSMADCESAYAAAMASKVAA